MKALAVVLAIFVCLFFVPIAIGIIGGVFGIIAGVFGGIFGIIGAVGGVFDWTFGGDYCDFGFFRPNGFTIAALILVIVIASKSKRGNNKS